MDSCGCPIWIQDPMSSRGAAAGQACAPAGAQFVAAFMALNEDRGPLGPDCSDPARHRKPRAAAPRRVPCPARADPLRQAGTPQDTEAERVAAAQLPTSQGRPSSRPSPSLSSRHLVRPSALPSHRPDAFAGGLRKPDHGRPGTSITSRTRPQRLAQRDLTLDLGSKVDANSWRLPMRGWTRRSCSSRTTHERRTRATPDS